MNRDFDVNQALEQVSALDRQYVGQLNAIAAADDLQALDAPFDDLSEQECLALVAGVETALAALEAPPIEVESSRGAPRAVPGQARFTALQRSAFGATGLAFAAGLLLALSNVLTPQSDVNLPQYVMHPPRADASYRGAKLGNVAAGALPTYTTGRTLEFVLQPYQRTEATPRVWAFDAREPDHPLVGLKTTLSDGGGLVVTLPTVSNGFEPRLGPTELVFLIGSEAAPAPSLELVNGMISPPVGFQRLTFPLRWAPVDSAASP